MCQRSYPARACRGGVLVSPGARPLHGSLKGGGSVSIRETCHALRTAFTAVLGGLRGWQHGQNPPRDARANIS